MDVLVGVSDGLGVEVGVKVPVEVSTGVAEEVAEGVAVLPFVGTGVEVDVAEKVGEGLPELVGSGVSWPLTPGELVGSSSLSPGVAEIPGLITPKGSSVDVDSPPVTGMGVPKSTIETASISIACKVPATTVSTKSGLCDIPA